jgi:hypothetical protein
MLENFLSQNSGYPLQGRVLDGRGLEDAVLDADPLLRTVEVGNPAMAVTSSVVDDFMKKDEDVAVAFRDTELPNEDTLLAEETRTDEVRLLA